MNGLSAWAQTATPSTTDTQAAIEQQRRAVEQERILREQLEKRPNVTSTDAKTKLAPKLADTPDDPCFDIKQVKLQTEKPQDLETFDWLIKYAHVYDPERTFAFGSKDNMDSPVGQCVGANRINTVLTRLQNALVKQGYTTTRVLAAPQDLKQGILTVQLVVGRIGKVNYQSNAKAGLPSYPQQPDPKPSLLALPMNEGDILNLRDVEMALENFKRVPTADADIKIEPSKTGNSPSLSDLNITQQQKTPYRGSIGFNDAGSKGTGQYSASGTLSFDQFLWANDLFYVSLNGDAFNRELGGKDPNNRGASGYVVHYSVPVGYWNFETTHSRNSYYQTVVGATRNYVYSGLSFNKEVKASWMFYRDATAKATTSLKLWQKKSNNYIDDAEVDVQRRITGGYDLGFYYRNLLDQTKQSSFEGNIIWREGTRAFGAMPAPEEAFDEGTARPKILLADATLTLPFQAAGQKFKYSANWRYQLNRTKLLAADRFAIGGRYTVRGYDVTLAAERGFVLRQDLGVTIPNTQTEFYLGFDYGHLDGDTVQYLAGRFLSGAALGFRGKFDQSSKFSFDIFWATPVNKPEFFRSAGQTAGMSLNYNF